MFLSPFSLFVYICLFIFASVQFAGKSFVIVYNDNYDDDNECNYFIKNLITTMFQKKENYRNFFSFHHTTFFHQP